MDANKLAKLREINFHIPKTCSLCVHASFAPNSEWGDCLKVANVYEHKKHSNNPKALSIFRGGTCNAFNADPVAIHKLGHYEEFVR